jgi:hypothetical protein
MTTTYQVHIIHITREGRNVFDVYCPTPHAAEAERRRHFKEMRGRPTQVAIDIRKVEIADEEEDEPDTNPVGSLPVLRRASELQDVLSDAEADLPGEAGEAL